MDLLNFEPFNAFRPQESSEQIALNFYETMKKRRTVRHFSSQEVCDTTIELCLRAAAQAPSGANSQPWHFAWIKTPELRQRIRTAAEKVEHEFYHQKAPQSWLDDLAPFATNEQKPYLTEAPVLLLIFTRVQSSTQPETFKSYYPLESTGIATGILISALQHCGLSCLTHTPKPMGFLNELLGLDKSYRPYLLLAVGHSATNCHVPRLERKPFNDISQVY